MRWPGSTAVLALAAASAVVADPVPGAACSPASLSLDRGETRRLVVCADALSATAAVTASPGLEVRYQQHLKNCGVTDERPGLQLVVAALPDARSGSLRITGESSCGEIPVTVPDRHWLGDARLRRDDSDHKRFLLQVDGAGLDLSAACDPGPDFPPADGLRLAIDPDAPAPRCSRQRLETTVRARDARAQPAKIVVTGARRADGGVVEAVAYATAPDPAWTGAMAESDARYVSVNGIRTRYFEQGRGEALLLVHGGQPSSMDGTAWDWQQNFAGLAERFHVYALDRVGQGYTDNPANLEEYRDYYKLVVTHVLGFMDAVGIERAHLVGHSQGSWPVTRIALDQPQRVASLTLVDGTMVAPSKDGGSAVRFYLYLSQRLHPASGETLESARRGMELFSYSGNNLTEQRVERLLTMTRQPKYAAAKAWFDRNMMSPAHPSFRALKQEVIAELEAGKLKVPVLVIWGQNDPEGSLPSGLALYRLVNASSPGSRLHIVNRSGHLPFIEYPDAFNRTLIRFALAER